MFGTSCWDLFYMKWKFLYLVVIQLNSDYTRTDSVSLLLIQWFRFITFDSVDSVSLLLIQLIHCHYFGFIWFSVITFDSFDSSHRLVSNIMQLHLCELFTFHNLNRFPTSVAISCLTYCFLFYFLLGFHLRRDVMARKIPRVESCLLSFLLVSPAINK